MIIDVSKHNGKIIDVSEHNGQIDIVIRDITQKDGCGIIIDVSEHNGKIDIVIRDITPITPRGASLTNWRWNYDY